MFMFYLILDTSGSHGIVAVCKDDTVITKKLLPSQLLSADLMPTIVELLNNASITVQDLNFLAIGIGPGSFTGTRIGIVSAKAIAYSLNLPIIDFCSHLAYLPDEHLGAFRLITDAKSSLGYVLDGQITAELNIETQEIKMFPMSECVNEAKPLFSPDVSLVEKYQLIKLTTFNATKLINIILKKFESKAYTTAEDLKALYLKGP
jgi:tRNA threonylcarbamoyl adenosine modification protein YeaZ